MTDPAKTQQPLSDDLWWSGDVDRIEVYNSAGVLIAGADDAVRRLLDAVAEVRALHQPLERAGTTCCALCSGWDGFRCHGVVTPWPCPTLQALDGSEETPQPDVLPAAVIHYEAGQTVHIYDWTLTGDRTTGALELTGTVAPGSHTPPTGTAVEVLRLDLPGRGQLCGIVARIHTLPQSSGLRLVLTTTVEAS